MNPTIEKFGYPASLVREYHHWVVLVRPSQVTLGSLVLAAKSDVRAYGELPSEAFIEQGRIIAELEAALSAFCAFERINYLMLMMVDPHVHFHVIPRYSQARRWNDVEFADAGWPGPPQLAEARALDRPEMEQLAAEIMVNLRQCKLL
ncbi:MAG TPA: HIT family protein [Sphingomicrobium sp.]|nr:HIT family protein [Sphingomicrobium sp.]